MVQLPSLAPVTQGEHLLKFLWPSEHRGWPRWPPSSGLVSWAARLYLARPAWLLAAAAALLLILLRIDSAAAAAAGAGPGNTSPDTTRVHLSSAAQLVATSPHIWCTPPKLVWIIVQDVGFITARTNYSLFKILNKYWENELCPSWQIIGETYGPFTNIRKLA